MLIHLNIQNYRVTDVAMPARYGEEASDLYMSKVLNHISAIALTPLRLPHLRKVHLTKLLAGSAFLVAAAANFPTGRAFFGLYLRPRALVTTEPTPTGSIMLTLVPIVLGFQLLLQAIVLDIPETPR